MVKCLTIFSFCSLLSTGAIADQVGDPMRPPEVFVPGGRGLQMVGDASSGTMLQSVLLSSGRRLAIINNQIVGVGDKVGEARLVSIMQDSVVLRDKNGTRRLTLLPVDKIPMRHGEAVTLKNGASPEEVRKHEGKTER